MVYVVYANHNHRKVGFKSNNVVFNARKHVAYFVAAYALVHKLYIHIGIYGAEFIRKYLYVAVAQRGFVASVAFAVGY